MYIFWSSALASSFFTCQLIVDKNILGEMSVDEMTCCLTFIHHFQLRKFKQWIKIKSKLRPRCCAYFLLLYIFSVISNGIGISIIFYTCPLTGDKNFVGEMSEDEMSVDKMACCINSIRPFHKKSLAMEIIDSNLRLRCCAYFLC